MTYRQQKRWCGVCNAVVFSRGHDHGQDVTPPGNVQTAAFLATHGSRINSRIKLMSRTLGLVYCAQGSSIAAALFKDGK